MSEIIGPLVPVLAACGGGHAGFIAASRRWADPAWRAKGVSTLFGVLSVPVALRALVFGGTGAAEAPAVAPIAFAVACGYYLWALALAIFDGGIRKRP